LFGKTVNDHKSNYMFYNFNVLIDVYNMTFKCIASHNDTNFNYKLLSNVKATNMSKFKKSEILH